MAKQQALPGVLDKKDKRLHDLAYEVRHCEQKISEWNERKDIALTSIAQTMKRKNLKCYRPAVGGFSIEMPDPKEQKPKIKAIAAADDEDDQPTNRANVTAGKF